MPERGARFEIKAAWLALRWAVATIEIDDETDDEPDAVVNCEERMARDAVAVPNLVVVIEVSGEHSACRAAWT